MKYCHSELDSESHSWTYARDKINFKTLYTCRGLRLEFGLFGRSENSSFSSILRAWFAFAHHRPTENPTGVMHWRGLQGILNHTPLCSAVQNDELKVNPLRDTPHPDLPQVGEGAFCRFPLNLGRGFARYPPQLGEHSVGFLLTWEGGLQDTLPNSGRDRVGSNYSFVIPGCDPESNKIQVTRSRKFTLRLLVVLYFYINLFNF